MENHVLHICNKCHKKYKNKKSLDKHEPTCKAGEKSPTQKKAQNITDVGNETYDINMTFTDENTVKVAVKKQDEEITDEEGEKALKEILKPRVSPTYRQEIEKLAGLLQVVENIPIPDHDVDKDATIKRLKDTIRIILEQSRNLIKEMEKMGRKNSYLKNNIMLSTYLLDKCRGEVPAEYEED